jgi:hypothetical protein
VTAIPKGYTGHARDLLKNEIVKDPGVKITSDVKILARRDGCFVIFDRRLPLGENAGVLYTVDEAAKEARRIYAEEIKPSGPAKQSAADDELFAAMARALANGFARHEPAYDEL